MMRWSSNTVDVSEICDDGSRLPVLARLPRTGSDAAKMLSDAADLKDTWYLLHSVRRCDKVRAAELRWHHDALIRTGTPYEIPSSYPGWFQVATLEGQDLFPNTTVYSLEEILASQTSAFLTHKPLAGFLRSSKSTAKKLQFIETTVPPGRVLAVGGIFCSPKDKKRSRHPPFRKRKQQDRKDLYVECTDQVGEQILLPLSTCGQFSVVTMQIDITDVTRTETSRSSSICQLADLTHLDSIVKLVHGCPPAARVNATTDFTGVLELQEKSFHTSLIACQLSQTNELAFIEFQKDSEVKFQLADSWTELDCCGKIAQAKRFCESNIEAFTSQMQVIFSNINSSVTECPADNNATVPTVLGKPILPPKPNIQFSMQKQQERSAPVQCTTQPMIDKLPSRLSSQCEQTSWSDSLPAPANLITLTSPGQLLDTSCTEKQQQERTHPWQQQHKLQHQLSCSSSSGGSAPATPPPRIPQRNSTKQEPTTTTSPVLDEDGFLIPLENRSAVSERYLVPPPPGFGAVTEEDETDPERSPTFSRGVQDVSATVRSENEMVTKLYESDANLYENLRHMHLFTCDLDRLESFLQDSITAVHSEANEDVGDSERNNSQDFSLEFSNFNDPVQDCDSFSRESVQFPSKTTSTTKMSTDNTNTFVASNQSRPCLPSTYQGYDSLTKTDSGFGTMQSTRPMDSRCAVTDGIWRPPDDMANMSVEEVSLSLRYIGTREMVMSRFSEEQIDGKMLNEMTNELLVEGFPEMNALERKKVLDFVRGWRPKRTVVV